MFKGYIPTKDKKPIEKVRGRKDFYKLSEVEALKEYGGVLNDNLIMVDIDNQEEADTLHKIIKGLKLKCHILTTTRGKHFYFKNSDVNKNCINKSTALGLKADVKLGTNNAVVPLKLKGKTRKLIEVKAPDILPKWLKIVHKCPNFNDLEQGDGRNQVFFNYILTLQGEGFTKDEIKETIKIINKYVLKDPLDKKELNIILRDEAFSKPCFFNNNNKLLHDKFALFLKNQENIIKIDGMLHVYKNGIYKADQQEIEKAIIKYIPGITKSKRAEVLSYIDLIAEDKELSNTDYIIVNNGLLNIKNNTIEEFNINYIAKNKIPVNYNPAAYHKVADNTLNKICCHDNELRSLIEEMMGYCLLRRNELGKSFILTGQGSNGKSTLLDIMKALIGAENISSIGLDEVGQRFKTAMLYGKLANIGDDISNSYIQDNSVFKKLVTGETVNVERKGSDPFDFNNYSKLIFSANEIPRINDTSNGLTRRLVLVPFNARFTKSDKDFDPFIKDKLLSDEALEYILKVALEGLKRVLTNRGFTEAKSVQEQLKQYEAINNPVISFLEEFKIENEPTTTVYLKYSTWCIESRLKPLSRIQFGREICKHGFVTKPQRINGKLIRLFVTDEK